MKLLDLLGITSSKGVFRGISILLSALSLIPSLAPYSEILREISAILGAGGMIKAVAVEKFAPKSLDLKKPGSVVTFEKP